MPYFNVEPYIEECIRSLYAQDIPQEEYEVICVDDCSPDVSRCIIERLQKEYPTLRLLVHTENKRQGGARNTGMKEARGRYIWFIDSDDYIKPNCLRALLEQAEDENLDILDFDFDADFNRQQYRKNVEHYDMGPCSGTEYVFNLHKGRWSWRCSSVWGELIKKELIADQWFRENVQYEDNDYALKMYALADRVHHIPAQPYFYRVVNDSTVHKEIKLAQINDLIQLIKSYTVMVDDMKNIDVRWADGIEELIRYISHQVLVYLDVVSVSEQKQFYRTRMGRISGLSKYVGKKTWLSMNSYCAMKLFKTHDKHRNTII